MSFMTNEIFWTAIAGVAASVAAGISGYQAVWLRRTVVEMQKAEDRAKKALEHQQKSTEQQLRAYVCIETVSITWQNYQNGSEVRASPIFTVAFANFGVTPAYNIAVRMWAIFDPYEDEYTDMQLPSSYRIDTHHQRVTLAPQGKDAATFDATNKHYHDVCFITEQIPDWEIIRGSETRFHSILYLYGDISYNDVQGQPHQTNFRYMQRGGNIGLERVYEVDNLGGNEIT